MKKYLKIESTDPEGDMYISRKNDVFITEKELKLLAKEKETHHRINHVNTKRDATRYA